MYDFKDQKNIVGLQQRTQTYHNLKWHLMCLNFISLATSSFGRHEEESLTALSMSFTWLSHVAVSMLMGCYTQSFEMAPSVCEFHIMNHLPCWALGGGGGQNNKIIN